MSAPRTRIVLGPWGGPNGGLRLLAAAHRAGAPLMLLRGWSVLAWLKAALAAGGRR